MSNIQPKTEHVMIHPIWQVVAFIIGGIIGYYIMKFINKRKHARRNN